MKKRAEKGWNEVFGTLIMTLKQGQKVAQGLQLWPSIGPVPTRHTA